ncbi:MAG: hypothetical protein H6Q90_6917, partial [Deltaproteobacteria bacterium]|nr:hypothetical protein [Deltaproteobacteria bacterium]
MPRSPFPSTTSLGLVALGALWMLQTGCPGGETCGPAGAPTTLVAGTDQITLTYGNLEGGLNNDCPDPAAPEGIISLSIHGTQIDGTGLLTLCVPRPDRLAKEELGFGLNVAGSDIRLIDVTGTANSCTFTLD